jgi:HD-GYP domain-containing protein (c-di-GMP phosphodiesterase class II)
MSSAAMRLLENVNRESTENCGWSCRWGSLRRVIPIVLAHRDKFDQSGYHPTRGEEIPIEARIISVADVYDSLTSDRPYRKARAEAFA